MHDSPQLLADQRRSRIWAELTMHGAVRTMRLAADLRVSAVTVRRDLAALQADGFVELVHGGARLLGGRVPPPERQQRATTNVAAKSAIATSAAGEIRAGDTIFMDSGTTCALMTPAISALGPLTVVTTDLATATNLAAAAPDISVFIAAGTVDAQTSSAVGEFAVDILRRFVFDVSFISASAWSLEHGATTGGLTYAAVKQSAREQSRRSCLLVDSTKFGISEPFVIATLPAFDTIFTDDGLARHDHDSMLESMVDLRIAAV